MQNLRRTVAITLTIGLWTLATAAGATAQLCGDADASGSVTVTDGVQVLRAAAALSSTCVDQPEDCDIDGSGSITVTDGVNILRKAAGLPTTDQCPSENADVIAVTDDSVPFLVLGLHQLLPSQLSGAASDVQAAATENCQDGGTRTTDTAGTTATVAFAACRVSLPDLGHFEFNGTATASLGSVLVTFDFTITDTEDNHVVRFAGSFSAAPRAGGGFVANGGPVDVTTPQGTFQLTFDHLSVDGDGHLVSGTATAEDTDDNFNLRTAAIHIDNGSTEAAVHVVFDDQGSADFVLDLETADLTPAN